MTNIIASVVEFLKNKRESMSYISYYACFFRVGTGMTLMIPLLS